MTPAFLFDQAGALVMLALALLAWRVRPRSSANRRFALVIGAWIVGIMTGNFQEEGWWLTLQTAQAIGIATDMVVIGATVAFALVFPTPLTRTEWRGLGRARHAVWLVPAAIYGIVACFVLLWIPAVEVQWRGPLDLMNYLSLQSLYVVWSAFAMLLALRARRSPPHARSFRSQAALVTVAVLLYPIFANASGLTGWSSLAPHLLAALGGLAWVLLQLAPAGLWLLAGEAHEPRLGRRVALALVGTAAAAMLYRFGLPDGTTGLIGGWGGIVRLLATSLLAYAIVKHQMFDIDLKVKWTLRQSTLAAIFVGVFFFVSEAAASWLGERTGSTYYGIAAAALLVFALAPLQRFVDRLADSAMPRVRGTPEYLDGRRREIYRAAVASAMRDGVVTEKERDVLATLADELGLSAGEARALEREAQQA